MHIGKCSTGLAELYYNSEDVCRCILHSVSAPKARQILIAGNMRRKCGLDVRE